MIQGMEVPVEVRVGPNGRLFGSVTGRHIAERLTAATGRAIDHRQVLLGAAIHEPGDYPVSIRLYREVTAEVTGFRSPRGLRGRPGRLGRDRGRRRPESDESFYARRRLSEDEDQSPDDEYEDRRRRTRGRHNRRRRGAVGTRQDVCGEAPTPRCGRRRSGHRLTPHRRGGDQPHSASRQGDQRLLPRAQPLVLRGLPVALPPRRTH